MRPRSTVQAIIIYVQGDSDGEFVPTRFEVNSWVTLMPGRQSGHAREAKKHGGYSVEGAYKGRILKFRLSPGSTTVSEVQVQHSYMHRHLTDLNPEDQRPVGGANYLYPSEYIDWVDERSLIGIVTVVHAEVGEPFRQGRSHKQLLKESIFFFNAFYYLRVGSARYGRLEPIPLPNFCDPLWPLSDVATSEAFRAKMRSDFLVSMKATTGSRQTHLQWFMPIVVMVDLFSCAESMHKTKTCFIFKNVTKELMSFIMDSGWDTKLTTRVDTVRCVVDQTTIVFRFHIGRSILYSNFQYNRHRLFLGNQWQPIDQAWPIDIVLIACEYGNWEGQVEVGRNWLLSNVRMEIVITLGLDCPIDFSLWIVDGDHARKLNRRKEGTLTAGDVLSPKILRVVEMQSDRESHLR